MKINLPVTHVEHVLRENDFIVTKMDFEQRIAFANDAFVRISGFSKQELIGSSHNIVRHPDMPPEVFADLWHSMKKNCPRSVLIKDRCKNGGFLLPAVSALHANDSKIATKLVNDNLILLYQPIVEIIQKLLQFQVDDTGNELQVSLSRYHKTRESAAC